MTDRKSISPMRRLRIWEQNDGRCHLCERKIQSGELWDVSHDRPLALLGEDGGDNLKVAHRDCHKGQTVEDMARVTKAKRQALKHHGLGKSRNPMPGSRGTRFKKHLDGRVTLR